MKKYSKAQIVAKNLVSGSYAAGCPANNTNRTPYECKKCERTA